MLFRQVHDFTENDHDVDSLEEICVSGNWATWIRDLTKYLGAVVLLDKHYIKKYIQECLAFCPKLLGKSRKAVSSLELDSTKSVSRESKKAVRTDAKRERVANTFYIAPASVKFRNNLPGNRKEISLPSPKAELKCSRSEISHGIDSAYR